jgi:hypothetical protein
MITRILWLFAGVVVAGVVGTFLFYVSVLSLVTTIAIVIGLFATLILGYLAGFNSSDAPGKKGGPDKEIDAPGDVAVFAERAAANARLQPQMSQKLPVSRRSAW